MAPSVVDEMQADPIGITVTAEVRWFFHGPFPAGVERWFGAGRTLETETREDRYVVLPGVMSVGIKLRGHASKDGPRLEVKACHGRATPIRPAAGVAGLAAAWSKWALVLDRRDAITSGLEAPIPVLTTHKRRSLRRLTLRDAGIAEVAADASIDIGCDVELSELTVAEHEGQRWWSLAFEAFGSKPDAWNMLHAAVPHFFEAHSVPSTGTGEAFDERSSDAYPAWLESVGTPPRSRS